MKNLAAMKPAIPGPFLSMVLGRRSPPFFANVRTYARTYARKIYFCVFSFAHSHHCFPRFFSIAPFFSIAHFALDALNDGHCRRPHSMPMVPPNITRARTRSKGLGRDVTRPCRICTTLCQQSTCDDYFFLFWLVRLAGCGGVVVRSYVDDAPLFIISLAHRQQGDKKKHS
jgi:hypothetical protein